MTAGAIERGLGRQLAHRADLLAAGQRPLGWKAAFGSPANLEKFGLDGPLLGFMTDQSVVEDGAEVDVSNWTRAVAEPEIVVRLGADIEPGAGESDVVAAVAALGPAIELVDIIHPPDDLEAALAVDVFHRGVIVGTDARDGLDLTGLRAVASLDGVVVAETDDLEAMTGRIPAVLSHLAGVLAAHGQGLRGGDAVICGSVVAPIAIAPGNSFEFELVPFPALSFSTPFSGEG